jgi:hypothetical protein
MGLLEIPFDTVSEPAPGGGRDIGLATLIEGIAAKHKTVRGNQQRCSKLKGADQVVFRFTSDNFCMA